MYKSAFDFTGQGDTTLRFSVGDEFNLIEQVNEHWWLMQSSTGDTGLVPSSYLVVNKTIKGEILESIDRAIDLIHKNAAKRGGPLKPEERHNLQKLLAHRQNVHDDKTVGTPTETSAQLNKNGEVPKKPQELTKPPPEESIYMELPDQLPDQPKRQAPIPSKQFRERNSELSRSRRKAPAPPSTPRPTESEARKARGQSSASYSSVEDGDPRRSTSESQSRRGSKQSSERNSVFLETKTVYVESKCKEQHISSISVSETLGVELVSKVMERVGIKEDQSQLAIISALEGIKDSLPTLSTVMDKIIAGVPYVPPKDDIGSEHELHIILDELSKRKNDSQQRSWALHEDFHAIQQLLTKLLKILAEEKSDVCKKVLQEDDYGYLNDLIVYYQMEPRVGLRILLIQTFGCFCQFGYEFVSQLLCSVLPTELAKELMETENISIFLNTALLLTMLFSTGENPPLKHYAQFNDNFIDFVFECIERPPIVDEYDQIPDALVSVLLSFNQHFKDSSENKVLLVMANRSHHTIFTEKILLLINRDDDPVSLFEYHKPNPSSILKMFQDIFSLKETSNIFYTNDLMVLIDIILRQLTDRSHGDKVRTQFLSLFYDIITNSNYREHMHRNSEFGECFTSILVDEENSIDDDKYIVRNICAEFNSLFPIFI
eukprot:gene10019-11042_t